jgi:TolB-like protein
VICAKTLDKVRYFISRPPSPAMNETPRAIAVLPFKNESTDSTNAYFINGLMESILMNLYNLPDLNVRSRTTVEKYRDSRKTLPEIARELHVNYIIEGSGQKYGDQVILNIQMLDAYSDKHLFSRQYNRKIRNVEDFFELQSDIASNLVSEIKIEIEPEDAWPVKTAYTSNFAAFQYYLKGLDLMIQGQGSVKQEDLDRRYKARDLFYRALELDPEFILPMVRLGWIYFGFSYNIPPPHNYLDSAFYFTNRAIQTDDSYGSTYGLMGRLYQRIGMFDKALENYRLAVRHGNDERSVNINRLLSSLYYEKGQYSQQVEYLYKQLHLEIEDQTDAEFWTLHHLFTSLNNLGFKKVSRKFSDWIFQQDKDSVKYLERQILNHFVHAHFDSVLMVNKERRKLDSLYVYWPVPWTYLLFKEYETALILFYRHAERLHFESANLGPAIIYRHMGQIKKADSILVKAIAHYKQAIDRYRGTNAAAISIIRLAGAYAVIGEKTKSLETLRRNKNYRLRMIGMVKYNPMFDPVREEPEFQEILEQMQEKYRSERKKTAELLTELGEIR